MPQCAITSCTNSQRNRTQNKSKNTNTVRFHRFPSDATTRSKWLRACGKQHNVNVDTARVCSLHFSPLSYKSDSEVPIKPNNFHSDQKKSIGSTAGATSNRKCMYKSRLKKGVIPHLFLFANNNKQNSNNNNKTNNNIKKRQKHYNLTTRQRFNNTLCAIKNSVNNQRKFVQQHIREGQREDLEGKDNKCEFVNCLWSDSDFPILCAVGLRPIKTRTLNINSNGTIPIIKQLLPENDTMLVMEESTEASDNIGSTPPRTETPIETPQEPTTPAEEPTKHIEETNQNEEEDNTKELQTEIKVEEVTKTEEPKTDSDESEKIIEIDDSDLIEIEEEIDVNDKRSATEPEEPKPKKLKLDHEEDEVKVLTEIAELDELIKQKEREWNNLIVAKKMKEIEVLRIQRKKQITGINKKFDVDWELALDLHIKNLNKNSNPESGVTILPIPSTSSAPRTDRLRHFRPDNSRSLLNKPRSILPKNTSIFMEYPHQNGATLSAMKTGPKGHPMMDVNLIVEKFRQSNPEVPRRGKRIRSVLRSNQEQVTDAMVSSTSRNLPLISMRAGGNVRGFKPTSTNLSDNGPSVSVPLGGGRGEFKSELGNLLSSGSMDHNRGRDSQNESSRSSADSELGNNSTISGNVSFKDALVEFARLSQQTSSGRPNTGIVLQNPGSSNSTLSIKPIPAQHCPEVTLHPVIEPRNTNPQTPSPKSSNSLLHGILTKNKPKNIPKTFTTLSPTLARLLTDTSSQPSEVSNIADLLANNQNRILETGSPQRFGDTPIDVSGHRSSNIQFSNSSVVNVDDIDNDDSLDRLIIDESGDNTTAPNTSKTQRPNKSDKSGTPSEVLHCQGCNKNSAQFVCAGCTNQWYCSRECQVQDWDRHCETCLG